MLRNSANSESFAPDRRRRNPAWNRVRNEATPPSAHQRCKVLVDESSKCSFLHQPQTRFLKQKSLLSTDSVEVACGDRVEWSRHRCLTNSTARATLRRLCGSAQHRAEQQKKTQNSREHSRTGRALPARAASTPSAPSVGARTLRRSRSHSRQEWGRSRAVARGISLHQEHHLSGLRFNTAGRFKLIRGRLLQVCVNSRNFSVMRVSRCPPAEP